MPRLPSVLHRLMLKLHFDSISQRSESVIQRDSGGQTILLFIIKLPHEYRYCDYPQASSSCKTNDNKWPRESSIDWSKEQNPSSVKSRPKIGQVRAQPVTYVKLQKMTMSLFSNKFDSLRNFAEIRSSSCKKKKKKSYIFYTIVFLSNNHLSTFVRFVHIVAIHLVFTVSNAKLCVWWLNAFLSVYGLLLYLRGILPLVYKMNFWKWILNMLASPSCWHLVTACFNCTVGDV